jgi:hypothetical protein
MSCNASQRNECSRRYSLEGSPCFRTAYKEIFQNVIAFDRDQWLTADCAVQGVVACTRVGLHTDDFIVGLALWAGKILSAHVFAKSWKVAAGDVF